ncbi:hypothetical protein [Undibacterium sp. YM2]|uniref:hypothetical protein n=1 Tax=Undibacterium sp. YM2 TaxID=2058625 RepID=UPI001389B585|nr:hypothetical protein [Undibacterium sp. YM2]
MAEKKIYAKFIAAFWKSAKERYPSIKRLDKPFCSAIPKSSSFYLGLHPNLGKHILIVFQASNKSWQVGEFAINIHISEKFEPTSNFHPKEGEFEQFTDGYYRFPSVIGRDKWWCLNPTSLDSPLQSLIDYWRPGSYEVEDIIIQEAVRDVCLTLESGFLDRLGLLQQGDDKQPA